MRAIRYADFDLRIERDASGYTARVLTSPAGEGACSFTLPMSGDRLENLILKIGRRVGSGVRGVHSAEMEAARELGGSLFEALFSGQVRDCYTRSLDQISGDEGLGLRFRLRLQDVPELADIPWEFLHDRSEGRFLAQSVQTPLVRYMEMSQGIRPLGITLPLRVLVMISSPVDQQQLDLNRERERLELALEPLRVRNKLDVTWLERATLPELLRRFRTETYHIFHFIGHGAFDHKRDAGMLILEDDEERAFPTEADRIGIVLHDHPSLRLAVLNSCEGARNSRNDPFAGVASNLVRQGIPAVVAMQFEISDEAAITFAGEFYAALAEGFSVDAAVAEARKAIFAQPNDVEWATPVLYMRSHNGVLFRLEPLDANAPRDTKVRGSADEIRQRQEAAAAARREQERRERESRDALERRLNRERDSEPPASTQTSPRPAKPARHGGLIAGGIAAFLFLLLILAFADSVSRSSTSPPSAPLNSRPTYDIPALQATVTNLRVFEGPKEGVPADQRQFASRFYGPEIRYLFLQLNLHFPAHASVIEAVVPCGFYRSGTEYATFPNMAFQLQPGWTDAWHVEGWGSPNPGESWAPGSYSVACMTDGRIIAQTNFEITN